MMLLLSVIHQGLIFSLVAIAVYLTSRVINKDDLSVEGAFGLGGAITALMLSYHSHPILAIILAIISGALAGIGTGVLYTRLGMNHLMAGLVTTTACFSLSLAMASANKNIDEEFSVFALLKLPHIWSESGVLLFTALLVLVLVKLFLSSELGLLMKTAGDNPNLLLHVGKSTGFYQILAFAMANMLTTLAGSLFVQWSGFFSISGNIGTLITGLTSLMIAELVRKKLSWLIILATISYQSIFAITLKVGLAPQWNNMIKASIIILLVMLSRRLPTKWVHHA